MLISVKGICIAYCEDEHLPHEYLPGTFVKISSRLSKWHKHFGWIAKAHKKGSKKVQVMMTATHSADEEASSAFFSPESLHIVLEQVVVD
jgi:nitrate/TMAO reductase-like tetraheme cytochrome c subunit